VRCDNEQLARDLVRVEALATRSSQLYEAHLAANASLVAGCEGAPAWVRDDLHYEIMSGWPDWVTSGRDRFWLESWIVCDFEDAQSTLDFDASAPGMNHCGFEQLSALTPVEHLALGEIGFGFWAAGAFLERAGASPALLHRYYRVMLLAIDSQGHDPHLLVEPGRIFDLHHDEVITPQAIEELEAWEHSGSIAIDARTPAAQLDWARTNRAWDSQSWMIENWVLEQRSPTGLAVRAPVYLGVGNCSRPLADWTTQGQALAVFTRQHTRPRCSAVTTKAPVNFVQLIVERPFVHHVLTASALGNLACGLSTLQRS
jgi:hypothetical protein